jgi:hypothetical protein
MKIMPLISSQESVSGIRFKTQGPDSFHQNLVALQPQAEAGCIARCVGASSAAACSYCGNDTACWESCAGSAGGASCVSNCFNQ